MLDLYESGAGDVEIFAVIHEWRGTFSHDLWDRWLDEEPEFSETIKKGRRLSEAWWQRLGREGAAGVRSINVPSWIFNMKNRFGWKDKHELSGNQSEPLSITIKKPK